jgi:phosphoribosylformylglycinamidine synthase subunit PurL
VMLGEMGGELGGSEYLATIHGQVMGPPPACDPELERKTIDVLLEAIRAGHVSSAHDCSDGGLAIAVAECCIAERANQTGAELDLTRWAHLENRAALFGESQARIVVSTPAPDRVSAIAEKAGVPCSRIGIVRSDSPELCVTLGSGKFSVSLERLSSAYHDTIGEIMSRTPEHAAFDETEQVVGH